MNKIFKVVAWSQPQEIQTQNGSMKKATVQLQEIGGQYQDKFVCSAFGEQATKQLPVGTPVAAKLRFSTHDHEGNTYQDIVAMEIIALNGGSQVF